MDITMKKEIIEVKQRAATKNIAFAEFTGSSTTNPWTDAIKSMNKEYGYDEFVKITTLCRFFYRTEPVVSTVVNKLVEIGINDLVFSRNKLSDNEMRLFNSLKPKLLEFAEQMAVEFLLSGLVVPEIGYDKVKDKNFIFALGVKKYNSLILPSSMWVRDPKSIKIYTHMLSDKPTYYVKISDEVISFIKSKGKLKDGKEDKESYEKLKKYFPEFVKLIESGEKEIPLDNELIIRRKYTSDNAYPISYISASLDALQHKRKLRRMDYTLIDKVISAILHVKAGNDTYPITESKEDQELLEDLREQLRMRGNTEQLMERIFQLVTNHTIEMKWVFPESQILTDINKYSDINQEILFGLGFPRILITGEAQRTGSSDPEMALISPIKTMENFRAKIIEVIRDVCREVAMRNGFKNSPSVDFKAISLHSFSDFVNGLAKLYDASALSRTSMAKLYGYDFKDEVNQLKEEQEELEASGLPLFGPSPFSANQGPNGQQNPEDMGKNVNKTGKNGVKMPQESDENE